MDTEKPKGKMGGARPGAGRPKGSTNGIRIQELKHSLERVMGQPFEDALAHTALKLYTDFQQDKNVDNWVRFSNNLSRYVIQAPQQEIRVESSVKKLTDEELNLKIAELTQSNDSHS